MKDLFKQKIRTENLFKDLKKIEQKQDNTNLIPVNHTNSNLPGDSKLRSELTLLQRKYNRLEQKEKRIQVLT